MELRDYLRILYANWVLILGTTLIGVAAAAALSYFTTPTYEAQAKAYVSVRTDSQASSDLLQGSNFAQQNMATFAELATTESVLVPVAEELELDQSQAALAEKINVVAPAESTLLNITVSDEDPERAAEIANGVATQLEILVEQELEAPQDEENASPVQIDTVESATAPTDPVSPRVPVNILLGLLLGVGVGIGIAILRHVLDTRIRSIEDIQAITNAPILGRIVDDSQAQKKPLIVHLDPKHPRAEAFRALRTNLQFLDVDEGSKTYVVSSAGPGEGKSTVATNLAVALAETGLRVGLVDCDLRKPRVDTYMGLEGGVGLTDVLIGQADLPDVLQQWGHSELYVLPAGRVPPNPSELLGSESMQDTLDELSQRMDIIIIDAPPMLMVTDAVVIGAKTQGVILVAAVGSTHQESLEAAVDTLKTAHVPLRGVVAKRLPAKGPGRYAYGTYAYAYADDDEGETSTTQERTTPRKLAGRRTTRGVRG